MIRAAIDARIRRRRCRAAAWKPSSTRPAGVGNYWTGNESGRVGVMKRIGVALVWTAAIGLMACQGKSPTAPGEGKATPNLATPSLATGASEMRPYDDDDHLPTLSVKMTANPTTIQPGQSTTLTWTSNGATSVTLEDERVAASGSKTVSPSVTKTYEIETTDGTREVESRVTVTVSTTAPPPSMPTANLTAAPMSITSGQSSMLTWTTSNATQVTLDGAVVSANGSKSVTPPGTAGRYTYTLVATNTAGSTTDTAIVTVTAPTPTPTMPTATLNANPASITSGQASTLS